MHTSQDLSARETGRLIAADKVEGTAVRNTAGDDLGTIDNVMIDKLTGKVAYAVMSFGGFLGIGNKYHAMPWAALKYDKTLGSYVVDMDKRQLQGAPTFEDADAVNWEDEVWGRKVHDYYKVPPYWY
jgi:hypothetical protein